MDVLSKSYIVACGLLMSISGALLKYFGASSATGQDEPPTSPTRQDSAVVSLLQDGEQPSTSSATQASSGMVSTLQDICICILFLIFKLFVQENI